LITLPGGSPDLHLVIAGAQAQGAQAEGPLAPAEPDRSPTLPDLTPSLRRTV
jgi:hypothetical protein